VGDVAVVLLARRQGEVVVGVELEMDGGKHGRVPLVFLLLRSNGSDDFTHHITWQFFCLYKKIRYTQLNSTDMQEIF
jgi:hypothetical protein